ncbi:MAG TPA: hypothetical protein DEO84_08370 [candidate division Zixibacteria bacterium]|nr:hypothetical protein [candidate division Zixibacteria bacterium]HBZ01315.1 hypothetical protein [candidate division Zixibacteria bacterium]
MKPTQFNPFRMPDFRDRPDGLSKSLKDSYIFLRSMGFPDRSLFIYPEGEFNNFKGEIIDQKPDPGEMVVSGDRIVLIAAVPGLCELLPDLFTDHHESYFDEDISPRGATERLFAIFDSAFLKMHCRLEWVRDIYAGIHPSDQIINYIGSLLDLPERKLDQIPSEITGFMLPALYGYLGTDSALAAYISAVTGIKAEAIRGDIQKFPIPDKLKNSLGQKAILGADLFLGDEFKGAVPEMDLELDIDDLDTVERVIPKGRQHSLLMEILGLAMPSCSEIVGLQSRPDSTQINFESGKSYLGYSSVLCSDKD